MHKKIWQLIGSLLTYFEKQCLVVLPQKGLLCMRSSMSQHVSLKMTLKSSQL
uniref:Uncharacterized protein n=1 Tax=Rhizophora mucronata TaxID=61149 RepID=A0A2P2PXB5_RHIMU